MLSYLVYSQSWLNPRMGDRHFHSKRRWNRVKKGLPGNCEAGAVTWLDLNFKCKRAQRSLRCRLPRCRSPPAPHRRGKTRGSAVLTPGLLFFSFLFFSWSFSSGRVRGNGYLHWYLGTYDLTKITPVFRGSVGTGRNTLRVSGAVHRAHDHGSQKIHTRFWYSIMVIEKKNSNTCCLRYAITALFFFERQITARKVICSFMKPGGSVRVFEVIATRRFFDSLIFFFPNTWHLLWFLVFDFFSKTWNGRFFDFDF